MAANPVLNDQRFEKVIAEGYGSAPITRTMTLGGTLSALGVLFALICATAWFGWSQVHQTTGIAIDKATGQEVVVSTTSFPAWTIFAALIAMGFAFATIFKPKWGPATAPLYAVFEGAFLGAISAYFNQLYSGIVVQAVLATLSVVLVMFILYATRIVKVTPNFVLITLAATGGIAVYYLVVNLLGYGLAPPLIGRLSDTLGSAAGPLQLRFALVVCPAACLVAAAALARGASLMRTHARIDAPAAHAGH